MKESFLLRLKKNLEEGDLEDLPAISLEGIQSIGEDFLKDLKKETSEAGNKIYIFILF